MTKRLLALLAAIGLLAAAAPAGAATGAAAGLYNQYPNGEVLVGYADGTFAVQSYESEGDLAAGLAALAAQEEVELLQPNYTYVSTALGTDDPLAGQQWALDNDGTFSMTEQGNRYPVYDDPLQTPAAPGHWTPPWHWGLSGGVAATSGAQASGPVTAAAGVDINLAQAWSAYDGGRDVIVALIDTGVDATHEDLAGAIWQNDDEIAGNGIDDDGNGYIDDVYGWNFYDGNNQIYTDREEDSHGTHGAGTIAARTDNGVGIAGIVPGDRVRIMVLKVLGGEDSSGSTLSLVRAIAYAEQNGAVICNLSLGGDTYDPALYRAMAASSMLFVAAAGNDGADTDAAPSYPASYDLDNILSVANLNYNGALHYTSNYGAESVDLAAPGSYILSTTPGDGYSYMTGTSMAAPMVTAAAAMVYAQYEELTLSGVRELLLASARELESLTGSVATGGMLDLGAAMTYDIGALSDTARADAALPFTDVDSGDWFYAAVAYAYQNGLMDGVSDTAFSPEGATTRGMIVAILWRLEGAPESGGSGFADVAGQMYYAPAVAWAEESGIVTGVSESEFAPDRAITREELAAILYRYAAYKGYDVTARADLSPFADAGAVSPYAVEALQWATAEGLIQGITPAALAPQGGATRAQAATLLMRLGEHYPA